MNERIKELRIALDMTQESFSQRLGIKRNTIGNYETGNRVPSNQIIFSICREFNVNEEWLRTGNGEMFNARSTDEELAYIVGSAIPAAPEYVKNTFIALGKLSKEFSKEDWEVVKKFVDALAGK
jgi:transcriptional regulator with XRE-family HTH domain